MPLDSKGREPGAPGYSGPAKKSFKPNGTDHLKPSIAKAGRQQAIKQLIEARTPSQQPKP